jgi:ketosteroid isomerase-like protein
MAPTLIAEHPELRALAVRYACGVDRRDPDLFVSAFCDDAVLVVHRPGEAPEDGARRQGLDDLRVVTEFIKRYTATLHVLGQTLYEVDGDSATGEVYCIAHHIRRAEGEGTDHIMHIRYRDRYARRADGSFGIAERHLWCDWTETLPIDPVKPRG